MNHIISILSSYNISKTKFRINLLKLFYDSKKPLSVFEIANSLSNSINKVTIYRALDAFENKGLIHQVPDIKNIKRYSLCNLDGCNTNSHDNSHGHFICYSCNQTFCLESISASNENLFKGFHVKEINLIAEGFCKNCYDNQYSSHL